MYFPLLVKSGLFDVVEHLIDIFPKDQEPHEVLQYLASVFHLEFPGHPFKADQ